MKKKDDAIKYLLFLGCFFLFYAITTVRASSLVTGFILRVEDDQGTQKWDDQYISRDRLRKMDRIVIEAKGKEIHPERKWEGVPFLSILRERSIPLNRIIKLTIIASDGYVSVLTGDLLADLEHAVCADKIQGQGRLPQKYGYMRLIFPGLRAMYWVNAPSRIVITLSKDANHMNTYCLFFHKSAIIEKVMKTSDRASRIAVLDLLTAMQQDMDHFHVLARDGLFREYTMNKIIRYMVLQKEKEGTFKIDGVNVPTGLKTRDVFYFQSGNCGLFLKPLTVDEKQAWFRHVWRNFIRIHFMAEPDEFILIMKNGEQVKMCVVSQMETNNTIIDYLFGEFHMKYPDLDHVEIRWSGPNK